MLCWLLRRITSGDPGAHEGLTANKSDSTKVLFGFFFFLFIQTSFDASQKEKSAPKGADLFSVARAGFEPTQSESKSEVLPLDDRALKVQN